MFLINSSDAPEAEDILGHSTEYTTKVTAAGLELSFVNQADEEDAIEALESRRIYCERM